MPRAVHAPAKIHSIARTAQDRIIFAALDARGAAQSHTPDALYNY